MIPRRALVNFLLSMAETPGMAASDTLLAVTTTSFDISILEFLLPLVCGAQIVIATAEQAADGRELKKLLTEHAVTAMQATPTTWRMLVESDWKERVTCESFAEAKPSRRTSLANYSPVAANFGTCMDQPKPRSGPPPNVSRQPTKSRSARRLRTPNSMFSMKSQARFRRQARRTVDWRHRPRSRLSRSSELTTERFVIDPTAKGPDARLYRTGDEVRCRPDGTVEFSRDASTSR